MPTEVITSIIAGSFLLLTAVVTSVFGWVASRRGKHAAEEAEKNAAYLKEQLAPSNGTRVIEYIEKNDERMESLIELIVETRDLSAEAAVKAAEAAAAHQLHEALFRHEPKE